MPANTFPIITGYDKLSVKIFSDRETLFCTESDLGTTHGNHGNGTATNID